MKRYLAAIMLSAAACAAQSSQFSLKMGGGLERATLVTAARTVAEGAPVPIVTVLYSGESDVWKAQTWRELQPDKPSVRRSGRKTSIKVPSFGGLRIEMELTATEDTAAGTVTWTMQVRNRSKGTVVGVSGPLLAGIRDVQDGQLYYPDRPGQRIANPWTALAEKAQHMEYPVPASMQYLAYSGPDEGQQAAGAKGVAYHVLDREMVFKHFVFGGPDRRMSVIQYPFIAPGGRWTSPPVVWQALGRDWHEAADRYRQWFRSWAIRPQISPRVRSFPRMAMTIVRARPVSSAMTDVPKSREVGNYAAALEAVRKLKDQGYDGTEFVGWFGQGHDSTYPDHLPSGEMGGAEGFRQLIAGTHELGLQAWFYLNARVGNYLSPTLKAHPEWEIQLGAIRPTSEYPLGPFTHTGFPKNWLDQPADVKPRTKENYGYDFAVLCPASSWLPYMKQEVVRVAKEYRGDGVQLDQIGAAWAFLCFNPTHGHRTPATAWNEGYSKMLGELVKETRQIDPSFVMWQEGSWEGSSQYLDISQGGFWRRTRDSASFPEMYRYTLPEHPMFGDPRFGGIPVWMQSDRVRARKIYDAAGPIFLDGDYRGTLGVTGPETVESRWFRHERKVLITIASRGRDAQSGAVSIALADLGHTGPPVRAEALGGGTPVSVRIENARLAVPFELGPRQVEAVLLEW